MMLDTHFRLYGNWIKWTDNHTAKPVSRMVAQKHFLSLHNSAVKFFIKIFCLCLPLLFTTSWAADSEHAEFNKTYTEYKNLFKQGDYDKSLPYAEKALELGKTITGPESKTTAILSHNYGINLLRANKAKQARSVLSDTVSLYKEAYGSQAPELIDLYIDLGEAKRAANYDSHWYMEHDAALSLAKKVYGANSVDYGRYLIELGQIEMFNQVRSGEIRIRDGYKIFKNHGAHDPYMARADFIMGKVELAQHHYKEARKLLENSLHELTREEGGSTFDQTVRSFLVNALEDLNLDDLATKNLLEIGRMQAKAGTTEIKPIFVKKPKFPSIVYRQQTGTTLDVKKSMQGSVILEFDVDQSGHTRNIHVLELHGPEEFEDPAIKALKTYRYAPRFVDGKPVIVKNLKQKYTFLIQD